MNSPASLEHKPVVVSENYEKVDGRMAGRTDAKALSLGLTQGNDKCKTLASAKVWRHTGVEWSCESEELPLHRVLDLSILLLRSMAHFQEAYRYEHLYDPEQPVLDRLALQGGAMTVAIAADNESIDEDIKLFSQALSDDGELLGERLRTLAKLLQDMGY
ncbi:hypothetical protein D3P09_07315 [Paenibacillus pinisoli]|uniref:Uncharacterized protein n=1 Tax=Paenibacillus pinisoli TaxID=1276110 RepID=A0A3A6PQM9_9BACL|nr:DUF6530 family protein [Paenibacillus pinisoli]RJX41748.1 hypothetical protein D3P09_07315 [Paenibacillus pinisoli]